MKLIIFDLETSSLDIEKNEILQVGSKIVEEGRTPIEINRRYRNEGPISLGAQVTTGIREEDLKDLEPFSKSEEDILELKELEDKAIWITYNGNQFDIPIIKKYGINPKYKIDLLKVVQHYLWLESPSFEGSFSLAYVRMELERRRLVPRRNCQAHDAFCDVEATEDILNYLIGKAKEVEGLENMKKIMGRFIYISNNPVYIHYFPFGAHKGKLTREIDPWYIDWALSKMKDLSPDLRYSLSIVRDERAGEAY